MTDAVPTPAPDASVNHGAALPSSGGGTDLAARYGTGPSRWRPLALALLGVLVAGAAAWVVWAMVVHGSPDVDAEMVKFDIVDDHTVEATMDVILGDGVEATCRLRSLAEDKNTVGDLAFTPHEGRNTVTVRTERLASSVELLGCTRTN
ncbi:MAG: DUF4307 domain-containing protein [Nocardioides sp.]|uniref:DUF4307 domain-containing protein n=1 Tax=Nocardioides sp. TaxID=35761 RepID=UPI003F10FEBF